MSKIKYFIASHKDYLLGLAFVSLTSMAMMLIFFNKSLTLQEGWYSIYARYLIDGLLPYKDFGLIVPPAALYLWTFIQYFFGDNFIVFHIADLFSKLLLVVLLYHIFTNFFSKKVAALSAFFSQAILIAIIFDNGVLSYNEYWVILMFIMTILVINQIKHLQENKSINNINLILLGIVFTIAFLTKQSAGPINITISVFIILLSVYKRLGAKPLVKTFLTMFTSSMISLFILSFYFITKGLVPYFIQNTFMSYGVKGSISSMLRKIFEILFIYSYVWPVFAVITVLFIIYVISKKKGVTFSFDVSDNKTFKNILVYTSFFLATAIASYIYIKYLIPPLKDITRQNDIFFKQLGAIGGFFVFFHAIYTGIQIMFDKEFCEKNLNRFGVSLMFLGAVFIHKISHGLPNLYPYLPALIFGYALSAVSSNKTFNIIKDTILYFVIIAVCFCSITIKLQSPSIFHGWKCGNITGPLAYSSIPKLKGLKLPVAEKEMYEDIYNKVNKYTLPEDKVLAFNNNQVFYELLEREPYTKHISLYYDVSTDQQSLDIIKKMNEDLPKAIVFFKFSPASEYFHESIFRNGNISGQRILGMYINDLICNKKYTVVSTYIAKDMIDEKKAMERFRPEYESYLKKKHLLAMKNNELIVANQIGFQYGIAATAEIDSLNKSIDSLKRKIRSARYIENAFIEENFELLLLIRTDIYDEFNKENL